MECIQYNGTVMVLLWWCEWWVGGRTVVDGMDTVLREKIHTHTKHCITSFHNLYQVITRKQYKFSAQRIKKKKLLITVNWYRNIQ